MSLGGFICVYEDVDYLEQTILSCKDHLDKLIIVEGAFQCTLYTNGKRNNRTERSSDGTLDIINKYVDNKKIFVKYANLQEHKFHYQIGLDFCKEQKMDWGMLIDSDEIYTPNSFALLKSKLSKADKLGIFEYRINAYCFINDFQHYYKGQYPRVFKVTPEAKFVFDNEVAWPDHGKMQDCGKINDYIHLLSETPSFYHYGYVRRKKRFDLKVECLFEKDHNPIQHQYKLINDKYVIPESITIYNYTGKHPTIMQKHKYYGKTAEEIIYGEKE